MLVTAGDPRSPSDHADRDHPERRRAGHRHQPRRVAQSRRQVSIYMT